MVTQSKRLSAPQPWQDDEVQPYVSIQNLTKVFKGRVAVNDV